MSNTLDFIQTYVILFIFSRKKNQIALKISNKPLLTAREKHNVMIGRSFFIKYFFKIRDRKKLLFPNLKSLKIHLLKSFDIILKFKNRCRTFSINERKKNFHGKLKKINKFKALKLIFGRINKIFIRLIIVFCCHGNK